MKRFFGDKRFFGGTGSCLPLLLDWQPCLEKDSGCEDSSLCVSHCYQTGPLAVRILAVRTSHFPMPDFHKIVTLEL